MLQANSTTARSATAHSKQEKFSINNPLTVQYIEQYLYYIYNNSHIWIINLLRLELE